MQSAEPEIWTQITEALDPEVDALHTELIDALEGEVVPEHMTLLWLRRLFLLLPESECPALVLRRAEAMLHLRYEQLSSLRERAYADLGRPVPPGPDFDFAREADFGGWHAWLVLASDARPRVPLFEIRMTEDGCEDEEAVSAARAENEVTEEVLFWLGRCLTVLPPHMQSLTAALVAARRELSRRNEALNRVFGLLLF